ncbi:hypothetical protein D3C80_1517170 [compost metagenome]
MAGGQTPAQQIIGEGDIVGRAGRIDRGDAVQGVEGRGEGLAGARALGQRIVIGVVAVLLIVGGIGRVRAEGRHGEVQLGQPIQTVVGEVRAASSTSAWLWTIKLTGVCSRSPDDSSASNCQCFRPSRCAPSGP